MQRNYEFKLKVVDNKHIRKLNYCFENKSKFSCFFFKAFVIRLSWIKNIKKSQDFIFSSNLEKKT